MDRKNTNNKGEEYHEEKPSIPEAIRNKIAYITTIALWIGNYAAFLIIILLVIGSMLGIWVEINEVIVLVSQEEHSDRIFSELIEITEHCLIALILLLIAVGIERIISIGIGKKIGEQIVRTAHLESLMIGLVVIAMSVMFLDIIFSIAKTATRDIDGIFRFGLTISMVTISLAVYLKFRKMPNESENSMDELIDKVLTKKEKEELHKDIKERLEKAIK